MVRLFCFKVFKKLIRFAFEILIIFPCLTGAENIQKHAEVLLAFRAFVINIADQRTVKQTFRLYPEILRRLLAFAFCICNQRIHEL